MSWITVPVREVVPATPRTRIIRLDLRRTAFEFSAGQVIMVGLSGSPLRKPYSIASAPVEARRYGTLELLLQVDEAGGLDPHLELAAAGTTLDIEGPFGTFGLLDGPPGPTLLIAGGTGIAPLRSMLVEWLSAPRTAALSLVYSARSPEELAYRRDLEAFGDEGRLSLLLTVTRGGESWRGRQGRINQALLAEGLPSPSARCIACGPPPLLRDVGEWLTNLGVPGDRYFTQRT